MSGGSYDYLCFAESLCDLIGKIKELEAMAHDLTALSYAEDAAAETEEVLSIMRLADTRVRRRLKRLHEVWYAMEWWQSGDYREEQFKQALERYRNT